MLLVLRGRKADSRRGNLGTRSHVDRDMGPQAALVTDRSGSTAGSGGRDVPAPRDERHERGERDEIVARLFDEHYRGLCRLAGLLLSDSAAAEEVVQEAFLRTFSGWWRVRHPERAQWYLRTSVVNLCRSRLRRRSTEGRGNRATWSDVNRGAAGSGTDPSDDALLLAEVVRRLPPRQRDAVVLRYYEDLPEVEIARILGCAVGTVKSQLSKARASLAIALGEVPTGQHAERKEGAEEEASRKVRGEPGEGGSGA